MTHTQGWQRARRPEQKEERRDTILGAAAELLDAEGLEGTGLNAIARRAGIAKANIYRYFESREAVLLQLLLCEQRDWGEAIRRRLNKLADSGDVDGVAQALADTLARRPRYCVLLASLAAVLEHNVARSTIIGFKRELYAMIMPVVDATAAAVPELSQRQAFEFLASTLMHAIGTWPHCNPAPGVADVLTMPEFAPLRFDFRETVKRHAGALLRGLRAAD